MNVTLSNIIPGLLMVFGLLFALYSLYFFLVGLFGLKRAGAAPKSVPKTRFALLVAARNEEAVIGQLVDSLNAQNYPRDMVDVIVAPNNCTDATADVALAHGAQIFNPIGKVSSKGEVLDQLVGKLLRAEEYDAVCVFDADNLVHPDFLQRMNDAHAAGAQAAQGFRDSKNPADTAVSTASSAWYWMLSRFYSGGREALGLSALINGSGFMISCELLRAMGGWRTETITEDYEFTAKCVLAGQRVHYVPDAVIYDEQPLTFRETVKQRWRWCTGGVQGAKLYLGKLFARGLRHRSCTILDLALTYSMPWVQIPSLLCGVATLLWTARSVWMAGPENTLLALALVVAFALLAWGAVAGIAALLMKQEKGRILPGTVKGILFFPLYALSWMPIAVVTLFYPTKKWEPIAHSRALGISQMGRAA